jgi:polyisoprenoid-binding protein YceI
MRYKILASAVLLCVLAVFPAYAGETFVIDPMHSYVGFSVRHLMVSTIKGRFTSYSGTVIYDEQDITKSSVEVSIKIESVNTDVPDRDKHLLSPEFFDAAKYPEATFKSTRIEKKADGYVAVGTFTIHGVSKEVAIPFRVGGKANFHGKTRLGIYAELTINRQDFGITWNSKLDNGGLVIGNDVKIELHIESFNK